MYRDFDLSPGIHAKMGVLETWNEVIEVHVWFDVRLCGERSRVVYRITRGRCRPRYAVNPLASKEATPLAEVAPWHSHCTVYEWSQQHYSLSLPLPGPPLAQLTAHDVCGYVELR